MIKCTSGVSNYRAIVTNGMHAAPVDISRAKGGGEDGFRPHELLEAALASCINTHVRTYADKHKIKLKSVTTEVSLDHSKRNKAVYSYTIELHGKLTDKQREKLIKAAENCSVSNTLSKSVLIERAQDTA